MYLKFSGRQATVVSQNELNQTRCLYRAFKGCQLRHRAMFYANVDILGVNAASIFRIQG
jgi:hypothetical protein